MISSYFPAIPKQLFLGADIAYFLIWVREILMIAALSNSSILQSIYVYTLLSSPELSSFLAEYPILTNSNWKPERWVRHENSRLPFTLILSSFIS
ncbi:unnamed protein product [Lactuca virosa]|uniref:Uncharacterized protein n=1 Tax=Lactuca virosa TaxID=75947 RepID=A0AAU9PMK3_9ASTR|nr:unnamed protein product [Lactuca virosa]